MIEKLNCLLRHYFRRLPPPTPSQLRTIYWNHFNQIWGGVSNSLIEDVSQKSALKKLQWAERHFNYELQRDDYCLGISERHPGQYQLWIITREKHDLDAYKMYRIFNDLTLE